MTAQWWVRLGAHSPKVINSIARECSQNAPAVCARAREATGGPANVTKNRALTMKFRLRLLTPHQNWSVMDARQENGAMETTSARGGGICTEIAALFSFLLGLTNIGELEHG